MPPQKVVWMFVYVMCVFGMMHALLHVCKVFSGFIAQAMQTLNKSVCHQKLVEHKIFGPLTVCRVVNKCLDS